MIIVGNNSTEQNVEKGSRDFVSGDGLRSLYKLFRVGHSAVQVLFYNYYFFNKKASVPNKVVQGIFTHGLQCAALIVIKAVKSRMICPIVAVKVNVDSRYVVTCKQLVVCSAIQFCW